MSDIRAVVITVAYSAEDETEMRDAVESFLDGDLEHGAMVSRIAWHKRAPDEMADIWRLAQGATEEAHHERE